MVKAALAAGVDIGGTKIAAALANREGLVSEARIVPTNARDGGAAVLRRATELLQGVLADSLYGEPVAVGVAAGGWIDPRTGRVISGTALLPTWVGTDLRSEFERASGLPTVALNDAQAIGVSEARIGAGHGSRVCLTVAIGTGMGGAITEDGRLFQGAHGMAGAIGHIPFRARGLRCSCGRRGCIEAYVSGPAIARSFARCAGRSRSYAAVGMELVVEALNSPDTALRACAQRVIAEAGTALGLVLGGVANALDPDVIVVGGGAALALGEPFFASVRTAIADTALEPSTISLRPSRLGSVAGVVGAALVALDTVGGLQRQGAR